MKRLVTFVRDEGGGNMAEYALIAALVAVVCIVAFTTLGTTIRDKVTNLACNIK